MHVVSECLLKLNHGEFRAVYDTRKVFEAEAHPELSGGHVHMRAMRYMEKRFVLQLWQAWRRSASLAMSPLCELPADVHDLEPAGVI